MKQKFQYHGFHQKIDEQCGFHKLVERKSYRCNSLTVNSSLHREIIAESQKLFTGRPTYRFQTLITFDLHTVELSNLANLNGRWNSIYSKQNVQNLLLHTLLSVFSAVCIFGAWLDGKADMHIDLSCPCIGGSSGRSDWSQECYDTSRKKNTFCWVHNGAQWQAKFACCLYICWMRVRMVGGTIW